MVISFPCNECNRKLNENPIAPGEIGACTHCENWFPCKICSKNVNKNHRSFQCSSKDCNQWVHIKCNSLTPKDHIKLQKSTDDFYCISCLSENIPFTNLNNNEFDIYVTKGINSHLSVADIQIQFLSKDQQKFLEQITKIMNRTSGDQTEDNDNGASTVNCNYYDINEFCKAKFNSTKSFSILHINIHSIQLHLEDLKILLQMLDYKFDIIAISESKIQKGIEPVIDITLNDYHKPIGTPTEATKGGVLLYISKDINFKPRNDLNIYESKKLESFFVEIIHSQKANNIIGIIYRHPCMPGDDFNDEYLKILTHKLNNEKNKHIYIAGDFNFDLLNASTHQPTSDFFDILTSNFLLPVISVPTKINSVNNTLIDNIFTNQFDPDLISGNLTTGISDHLPSFLITPNPNQHHLPKKT